MFHDIRIGDYVLWNRPVSYGGPVRLCVTMVTAKRFIAMSDDGLHRGTFRKKDGRVVGNPHHIYFVSYE